MDYYIYFNFNDLSKLIKIEQRVISVGTTITDITISGYTSIGVIGICAYGSESSTRNIYDLYAVESNKLYISWSSGASGRVTVFLLYVLDGYHA